MNICFVTSECLPFAKTGGLADVSAALPSALAEKGHAVKLFMPLYDSVRVLDHGFIEATELRDTSILMGSDPVSICVWYGRLPGSEVEVYLIDCPHYYHRGQLYTNHTDESERFILLQHAAFIIMQRFAFSPDIIHCNDWQTALMPAMLKYHYNWDRLFSTAKSVLSIHNLAYQGKSNPDLAPKAGLPREMADPGGLFEYGGAFSFLKTGIMTADRLSTVSPTYAKEIQTGTFGEGLDDVLRKRSECLNGILNGIDVDVWNPATDPYLPFHFDAQHLSGKAQNKRKLCDELGLSVPKNEPLIGIVSRFATQKGFELLLPIFEDLIHHSPLRFAILGSGDPHIEHFFEQIHERFPTRVAMYRGYNEGLAHCIEASSDLFLMPSFYEPCGLNQMYSLRYGTVPVVHKTGGLADTVIDADEFPGLGNGFSFWDASPHVLKDTLLRAVERYEQPKEWAEIQQRGMNVDFSWSASVEKYEELYRAAMNESC